MGGKGGEREEGEEGEEEEEEEEGEEEEEEEEGEEEEEEVLVSCSLSFTSTTVTDPRLDSERGCGGEKRWSAPGGRGRKGNVVTISCVAFGG
jgi:hypothetical protein